VGVAKGALAYPPAQFVEFRRRVEAEIEYLLRQPPWPLQADALQRTFGCETEIVFVDSTGQALRVGPYVIRKGRDKGHSLVDELLRHQGEANGSVFPISPGLFRQYLEAISPVLDDCQAIVEPLGGQVGLIGVLPSLTMEDLRHGAMSPGNQRFLALGHHLQQLGPIRINIGDLNLETHNFCLAGAGNSEQTHRSVFPGELVAVVNAGQMAAGLTVAATAGSPVLLGAKVGAEGRIPLFTSAFRQLPTLGPCLQLPSGRITWARTIRQVLEYCLRFPVVLPELQDTPVAEAWHWRFYNGLIHPWICPTYYPQSRQLGIEGRTKPAGPTLLDQAINHAIDLALTAALTRHIGIWIDAGFPYDCAVKNFENATKLGLEALLHWPNGDGRPELVPARDIVLGLLDKEAVLALADLGVGLTTAQHILGLAKERVGTGRTAAHWITEAVEINSGETWEHSLALVTLLYLKLSANGREQRTPVHLWEPATTASLSS
jgi:hypothetical protein